MMSTDSSPDLMAGVLKLRGYTHVTSHVFSKFICKSRLPSPFETKVSFVMWNYSFSVQDEFEGDFESCLFCSVLVHSEDKRTMFSSDAFDGCGGCEYIFRVKTAEHSGHANEEVVTAEVDATGPVSSDVVDEFILKAYQKPS